MPKKLPRGVLDAWQAAGSDRAHDKTYIRDRRELDGSFAWGRYDRIYFTGPYKVDEFRLCGKERYTKDFPSDHFAVCVRFRKQL